MNGFAKTSVAPSCLARLIEQPESRCCFPEITSTGNDVAKRRKRGGNEEEDGRECRAREE